MIHYTGGTTGGRRGRAHSAHPSTRARSRNLTSSGCKTTSGMLIIPLPTPPASSRKRGLLKGATLFDRAGIRGSDIVLDRIVRGRPLRLHGANHDLPRIDRARGGSRFHSAADGAYGAAPMAVDKLGARS